MRHLCTILCGLFHLSAVIQSATVEQDTGVRCATVGENVTLRCSCDSEVTMHFSWYRQELGGRPEMLSSIYKFDNPSEVFHQLEKNPRFSVEQREGTNDLHISDVHFSDSSMYYCGSSHSNMMEFGEGVFLSVEGGNQQEIVQEPASETIPPGGSVTLNCTLHTTRACDEGHVVHWFRHGSHQGILHTHRDQCKSPPLHRCVYHLQKGNLSSSDTGTYYCAVASCGQILFGGGTELLVREDVEDQKAQIRSLVWLSVIRVGILVFVLVPCLLFVFVSKSC